MINEIINQIDENQVKEDYEKLFIKSCTEELNRQEELEKNRLEKVIIILKNYKKEKQ